MLDIRAPTEQTEGTRSQVLRWLKAVGDTVLENEPLIEIETDKVTVEVAAPASGVLREILKTEQEAITPDDVLGRIEPSEAAAVGMDAGAQEVGRASARPPAEAQGAWPPQTQGQPGAARARPPPLSPAVRRLLQERGLDPTSIRGSGEGGRITVDDVLAYEPARAPEASADRPAQQSGAGPSSDDGALVRGSRIIPHTAVRKRIAEHMVQSLLHTAPHVTTVFEADLTAVGAHRARHRADFERQGAPLTYTAYFVAATVDAIRAVPEANSRWTDSALELYDSIHIGVATAVEGVGLLVPVLRDVESRSLLDVARSLNDIVSAAREGRLQPSDVRGGTFTLSNHGVSGSLLAAPIVINQPQSAILGIGKLEQRLVASEENGEVRVIARPKCYVTLTIDHRVMDGHQANRFLQTFVRKLESWPAQ